MRIISRITGTALGMLVPALALAAGIQVVVQGKVLVFDDVEDNSWYAVYVREAASAGIVNGYKDRRGNLTGLFGPEDLVTVAQALKIAIESAGIDEGKYGFVQSGVGNHWASLYVSAAKAEDFPAFATLNGNLDRAATRAEVAALFTAAFGVDVEMPITVNRYTDVDASTEFGASIEALSKAGVVAGDTDDKGQPTNTYRPTSRINRAETVKISVESRSRFGLREAHTVSFRGGAFLPQTLRVKSGMRVWFRNDSSQSLWVASNPHPTHGGYDGFDAERPYEPGEVYAFVFTRPGTFGYHNHLDPRMEGTIIVE